MCTYSFQKVWQSTIFLVRSTSVFTIEILFPTSYLILVVLASQSSYCTPFRSEPYFFAFLNGDVKEWMWKTSISIHRNQQQETRIYNLRKEAEKCNAVRNLVSIGREGQEFDLLNSSPLSFSSHYFMFLS